MLGNQLLRSGTSVAANYREASRARCDSEFVSKIDQCAQEADESLLWLELLRDDCGIRSDQLDWLLKESDELIAIFVTMPRKAKCRIKDQSKFHLPGFKSHSTAPVSAFSVHVSSLG